MLLDQALPRPEPGYLTGTFACDSVTFLAANIQQRLD